MTIPLSSRYHIFSAPVVLWYNYHNIAKAKKNNMGK